MYLNPPSHAICGGNARLEEEPGSAHFTSLSPPVQRALLAPNTFTQAQIHWEGSVPSLRCSWLSVAFLQQPK